MFGEQSAVDDLALNVLAFNAENTQLNASIRNQNARSGFKIASQSLESSRNDSRVPSTSRGVIVT